MFPTMQRQFSERPARNIISLCAVLIPVAWVLAQATTKAASKPRPDGVLILSEDILEIRRVEHVCEAEKEFLRIHFWSTRGVADTADIKLETPLGANACPAGKVREAPPHSTPDNPPPPTTPPLRQAKHAA